MRSFRTRLGALTLAMVMAVGMNSVFSAPLHASTLTPTQVSALCAKAAAIEAYAATVSNTYFKNLLLHAAELIEQFAGGCGE